MWRHWSKDKKKCWQVTGGERERGSLRQTSINIYYILLQINCCQNWTQNFSNLKQSWWMIVLEANKGEIFITEFNWESLKAAEWRAVEMWQLHYWQPSVVTVCWTWGQSELLHYWPFQDPSENVCCNIYYKQSWKFSLLFDLSQDDWTVSSW